MGFVDEHPQIKGVLWTAGMGHVGMEALGEVINGSVNPSGKLVDTYVYNFEDTPWWNNFGDFNYTNMDDMAYTSTSFITQQESTAYVSFINYVEGIYVGYKFYETAAAEGLINYDEVVQYPFGYGLSTPPSSRRWGTLQKQMEISPSTLPLPTPAAWQAKMW
jgi:beta-glucosidase